jgi:hypothetical protein
MSPWLYLPGREIPIVVPRRSVIASYLDSFPVITALRHINLNTDANVGWLTSSKG